MVTLGTPPGHPPPSTVPGRETRGAEAVLRGTDQGIRKVRSEEGPRAFLLGDLWLAFVFVLVN